MSVSSVVRDKLCIGCEICSSICPKNCISYELKDKGIYEPVIDQELCVECGLCEKVCPGKNRNDGISASYDDNDAFLAYSMEKEICDNATSGGVVTSVIKKMLESNTYDVAFAVKGNDVSQKKEAVQLELNDIMASQKSRYITVSHANTAKFMLENPEKKVIIVGTPCAVSGLINLIELKKLNRDNYLFIGLFCDGTMSYNVLEYFEHHPKLKGGLKSFNFRDKNAGGWPGNILAVTNDNTEVQLHKSERMMVKSYFKPERCLYCLDKLNRLADISVGDNYVEGRKRAQGGNTVIINTDLGRHIWFQVSDVIKAEACDINDVIASQKLELKLKNQRYFEKREADIECAQLLAKVRLGEEKQYKTIYNKTHNNLKYIIKKLLKKV